MQAILENPEDATRVRLLFANSTETDILMAEELVEYQLASQGRIEVHHVISKVRLGLCVSSLSLSLSLAP